MPNGGFQTGAAALENLASWWMYWEKWLEAPDRGGAARLAQAKPRARKGSRITGRIVRYLEDRP